MCNDCFFSLQISTLHNVLCNHPATFSGAAIDAPKSFRFNEGSKLTTVNPPTNYQGPPPGPGGGPNYDPNYYNNYQATAAPSNQWIQIQPKQQNSAQNWQGNQGNSWQNSNNKNSNQNWQRNNRQNQGRNQQSWQGRNQAQDGGWQSYDSSAGSNSQSWQQKQTGNQQWNTFDQNTTPSTPFKQPPSANNFGNSGGPAISKAQNQFPGTGQFSMPRNQPPMPPPNQFNQQNGAQFGQPNTAMQNTNVQNSMAANPMSQNNMAQPSMSQNNLAASSMSQNNMAPPSMSQNSMVATSMSQNNMAVSSMSQNNMAASSMSQSANKNSWYKGNSNNKFNFSPWQKSRVNLIDTVMDVITPSPQTKFPTKVMHLDSQKDVGKWMLVGQTLATQSPTTQRTTPRPTPQNSLISGYFNMQNSQKTQG